MAVKIKLTRLGKIRNPQYRIAVADARTRRDGRAIEVIGRYHPKEDPSLIEIDSERAQYWLGVGAQPTEPVLKLLQITGDWQKFKGLPGAEGTLKVKEPKPSKLDLFNAALAEAEGGPSTEATMAKKKKAPAKKAAETAEAEAPAEAVAPAEAEAPAEAVAPAEAEAPAEAVAPAEAEATAEAVAPAEAEATTEAVAPAEAEAPAEAAEQAESAEPTES
jgi:small subunit ribosomal protein S16